MALFRCDIKSKELGMYTALNVIIPGEVTKKDDCKVVYLLHWVLDVAFNEANCRMRKDNSGENFAVIRHIGS